MAHLCSFTLYLLFIMYACSFSFPLTVCAQDSSFRKPVVDTGTFDKWPGVGNLQVSPNGKYVTYTISNQPIGNQTLVIQAGYGDWNKKLAGVGSASFTGDSRRVIYTTENGKLCNISLRDGRTACITGVSDYILNDSGDAVVYISKSRLESDKPEILNWLDLTKDQCGVSKPIWRGMGIAGAVFDKIGKQLAFITNDKGKRSIWNYRVGNVQPVQVIDHLPESLSNDMQIAGILNFSLDGERLFIMLEEKTYPLPATNAVKVDVWNYKDVQLQSRQLRQKAIGGSKYMAVLNLKTLNISRLQQEHEEIQPISNGKNDEWALIIKREGDEADEAWNRMSQPSYYLVSLSTGRREQVDIPFAGLSPAGKYFVGEDGKGNFYTREVSSGKVYEVTKAIPVSTGDVGYDKPFQIEHRGLGFWDYWLDGDSAMLIYDRYDIWQVDPQNKRAPLNLTKNFGRRRGMTLRFIAMEGTVFSTHQKVILDAFDNRTKYNGFYSLVLGNTHDPRMLTMGPYVFYARDNFYLEGERPQRLNDGTTYIVRRGSATAAPNYYRTRDFRYFVPISQIFPERKYNWLSTELLEFTTLDGRREQGILYKPEDFDPGRKYPVIVYCYETASERLHQYRIPGFSAGDINIPYFVSRGYLVFIPDIHFKTGKTGESAYNTVVAAVKHLHGFPWVDVQRIGISSRSFGGFLVNYIITHCNAFAAACSDAGVANLVSGWGTYELNTGLSLHDLYERTSYRLNATPWQESHTYIENSPIFEANKVTMPVLLVNNGADAVVHMDQSVQFFTALKKLGKKAWMLSYPEEGHNLLQKKNQLDLTVRITQFFDHFLKAAPVPAWMAGAAKPPVKAEQR